MRGTKGAALAALGGRFMQDPASELPRTPLPRTSVNRKTRTMNDAARRVFLIPSIRTWTMGGALRMEGQNVPDLEQMDVN